METGNLPTRQELNTGARLPLQHAVSNTSPMWEMTSLDVRASHGREVSLSGGWRYRGPASGCRERWGIEAYPRRAPALCRWSTLREKEG